MYYSSVFIFSLVVVVNLSLSGAQSPGRFPPNYNEPPKNTVVNIGNGFNKRNIVTLDQGSNNGQLGYRFNEPTPNFNYQNSGPPHWPQMQGSTTNNIGNGIGNKNTVVVSGDRRNGGQSYGTDKFNVGYGPDNNNQIIVNGRPIIPKAPVNGGRPSQTNGRPIIPKAPGNGGIGNKNTVVVSGDRGNVGQSYGTDKFNVGYGTDNNNQIIVNGRPIIPKAPVNGGRPSQTNGRPIIPKAPGNGGKPSQTNGNAAYARNSDGSIIKTQINHIIVNGKPVKPDSSDSRYDTYYVNEQSTIHIQKSG